MRYFGLILLICVIACGAEAKTNIQVVTSQSGITAWLVEEHATPIIAMHMAWRGGVEQDSVDKQGLSVLATSLLTQGAGADSAASFQQKLADRNITLRFNASRDALHGALKCLSQDRATAFQLLKASLSHPRFDQDEINRVRSMQIAAQRGQYADPEWQARYTLFQRIYGQHPYSYRSLGTAYSLSKITRGDFLQFTNSRLARDNLVIAVAGDITAKELSKTLDDIFGYLPPKSLLMPIAETTWPERRSQIGVPRDGAQSNIFFAMPGPKRNDSDWYAIEIANYILGGGGFSSRLMKQVREERGLTYGLATLLSPMQHGGLIIGQAASDNRKAAEAVTLIQKIISDFYDNGVTNEEVTTAIDDLAGSTPLALTSTDKIAGAVIGLQLDGLPSDYLDQRARLLNAVSVDEVNHAIKKWYDPARIDSVIVGKPTDMDFDEIKELARP